MLYVERVTKGSERGWEIHSILEGMGGNLRMLNFHGEGCKGMEKDVCT